MFRGYLFLIVAFVATAVSAAGVESKIPATTSEEVQGSIDAGHTVLVKFGADWCGPCRQSHPAAEEYAADGGRVMLVDIDRQPALAQKYGIGRVPSYIVFKQGKEAYRHTGAIMSFTGLKLFVRSGRHQ